MGLKFHYQPTPAKTLLEVENLGFSFSGKDDEFLFKDLSFHLKPCECLAVIGKNGKGKTTLLNVLAGLLPPSLGQIRAHPATAIGYYQQTNRKDLDPKNSVVKEIALANEDLSLSQVRAICGAMMFSGDDAEKKISVLSGGEQGRVLLGKILATPTNLLLLDEPSNHLDMDSIEVLTEELSEFPGGVIIVTHNEEMLRRLATRLIVFRHGGAEVFLGTYDEFLEKMGWEEEGVKSQQEGSSLKLKADPKQVRRQRAALITERAKKLKPLESQLEETEARIQELENEMEAKNQAVMELISQQNEGNGQQIQELYKSIGSLQLEIESAFGQMEKLLYEIEVIRDEFDRRLKEPE